MKTSYKVIVSSIIVLQTLSGIAQTDQRWLSQLEEDESLALEALVLYPDEVREDIFQACLYPELLVRLAVLQKESASRFEQILEPVPTDLREAIWDMSRYKGLLFALAGVAPGDRKGLEQSLRDFPEVIHARAKSTFNKAPGLIRDVADIMDHADRSFTTLMLDYPKSTALVFQNLLEYPELLELLNEEIRLTVIIGDWYSRDPAYIREVADSLGIIAAEQHTRELADWQEQLNQQEDVTTELEQVAEDFETAYGYDDAYYAGELTDDLYYRPAVTTDIAIYYYYHYPYWLGYPYWYAYPRWRPLPFRFDLGFYFAPGRPVVVINLPSIYFTNWYFSTPYHHYRHPKLSRHFVNYYYGHRNSTTSIPTSVRVWKRLNQEVINDSWLRDDGRLEKRLSTFGKFEEQRLKYNERNPSKTLSPGEFLEKSSRNYPEIQKSAVPPTGAPAPKVNLRLPERKTTTTNPTVVSPRGSAINQTRGSAVEKAKDNHQNIWKPATRLPSKASETKKIPVVKPKTSSRKKKTGN